MEYMLDFSQDFFRQVGSLSTSWLFKRFSVVLGKLLKPREVTVTVLIKLKRLAVRMVSQAQIQNIQNMDLITNQRNNIHTDK